MEILLRTYFFIASSLCCLKAIFIIGFSFFTFLVPKVDASGIKEEQVSNEVSSIIASYSRKVSQLGNIVPIDTGLFLPNNASQPGATKTKQFELPSAEGIDLKENKECPKTDVNKASDNQSGSWIRRDHLSAKGMDLKKDKGKECSEEVVTETPHQFYNPALGFWTNVKKTPEQPRRSSVLSSPKTASLSENCEEEDANTLFKRGKSYGLDGGTEKPDKEKAKECYEKAANLGHAKAQYYLACCFDAGEGVEKNPELAFTWYKKAADQGIVGALTALGYYYEKGIGVERNIKTAVEYYQKAAELGDPIAQANLAVCIEKGDGVDKPDPELAFTWYKMAADQGDAEAQYAVAHRLFYGKGIKEDKEEGIKWYQKAAEQGHTRALHALFKIGKFYYFGEGLLQNKEDAVKCFKLAAKLEHSEAQFYLGFCYKKGEGVEKPNREKAIEWYQKSVNQGNEKAKKALSRLLEEKKENEVDASKLDHAIIKPIASLIGK